MIWTIVGYVFFLVFLCVIVHYYEKSEKVLNSKIKYLEEELKYKDIGINQMKDEINDIMGNY